MLIKGDKVIGFMKNALGCTIEHTQAHVHVAFDKPRTLLSSAVFNGGFAEASHIINLRVPKNIGGTAGPFEPSHVTLSNYCRERAWEGTVVGMMTAAKSESYRMVSRTEQGVEVATLVTVTAAGDAYETQIWVVEGPEVGGEEGEVWLRAHSRETDWLERLVAMPAGQDPSALLRNLQRLEQDEEDRRRDRNLALAVAGGTWLLSVLDTAISFGRVWGGESVRDGTSLGIVPVPEKRALAARLRF